MDSTIVFSFEARSFLISGILLKINQISSKYETEEIQGQLDKISFLIQKSLLNENILNEEELTGILNKLVDLHHYMNKCRSNIDQITNLNENLKIKYQIEEEIKEESEDEDVEGYPYDSFAETVSDTDIRIAKRIKKENEN